MSIQETIEEIRRLSWNSDYRKLYESGEAAINSFMSSKDQKTKEFYAITLSPVESKIHSKGIWYDIDARERLVIGLWNQVKHQMNRSLNNNYRRYPEKQIKDFVAVEHYDKNKKALIKPHLHGTLAIPKESKKAFEESFDEHGSFNLALEYTDIYSVLVNPIYDLNYWTGYVLKQQFGVTNK